VGFLEFLNLNMDTLAVGRWAGTSQLGLYNRANLLADLPAHNLMHGLSQVLFPSFSAVQHDKKRVRSAYLSAVGAAASIVLPLNAGMAVAAPEIVLVVLGPQWTGAVAVLPWLLLASSLAMVGHFAGVVTETQAALNGKMIVAGTSAATLALLLLLASGRSLAAYGAALAASAVVTHVGYVRVLARALDTDFRLLVRPYGPATASAAAVAVAIGLCRIGLMQFDTPAAAILGAEVVAGALTLGVMFRFGPLRTFRADIARRLTAAGVIRTRDSTVTRLVSWLIGTPNA
jgi:lipopolysaccharide exporter